MKILSKQQEQSSASEIAGHNSAGQNNAELPAPPDLDRGPDLAPDLAIDITALLCPMTFVRTRLALDRLQPGQVLAIRLRGDEPRRNVPRTATEQGHAVLAIQDAPDGTTTLLIRKASPA